MHVGILTAPLREQPLSTVIPWAAEHGITALEVDVSPGSHLDAATADDRVLEEVGDLLAAHSVRISSLGAYSVFLGGRYDTSAEGVALLERAIGLAPHLGVTTVCTLAGMPMQGKNRTQTIEQDLPGVLRPLLDRAGERGVRLALENWYATNIQHLDHWRRLFEVLPDRHLGLNFDPSHLDWQGIDSNSAVREFRERIFHVHAKDVSVDAARLARVGYQGEGWWRYVLPGYGRINWGDFIGTLRDVGYDDVLSIEHEDRAFPAEEGFIKSARYLSTLV